MISVDEAAVELDSEARKYQRWSAGDLIRLVFALGALTFGLFLAAIAQHTIGGAEEDIISWFNRLPDRTIGFVIGLGQLIIVVVPLAVWACSYGAVIFGSWECSGRRPQRRRWR